ncbi:hypothetical protein BP00DRAFT_110641 [Aspergillus indologenus CBS 114.80]|uniref:Uncharacterized protein n=1 Tax=Aspergillus indologenus CBS 114.80 TaxID=1450541 RepID=A0A2V5IIV6_9EURO|nr:hypothetical protein BP00DRAFT_110641 [Aspergillus indologenus CBS 114.80]
MSTNLVACSKRKTKRRGNACLTKFTPKLPPHLRFYVFFCKSRSAILQHTASFPSFPSYFLRSDHQSFNTCCCFEVRLLLISCTWLALGSSTFGRRTAFLGCN